MRSLASQVSAHISFVRIVVYKYIQLHRVRWSSAFHQNGARARCQKQPPPKYTVYTKHVSLEAGDSDAASSDTESASSSSGDEGSKQGQQKAEPPGFFILQHRNAQDNIRVLSEQKLKVAVRMNVLCGSSLAADGGEQEAARRERVAHSQPQSRQQHEQDAGQYSQGGAAEAGASSTLGVPVSLWQLEDKEQLLESLNIAIQETSQQTPGGEAKTQGLRHMVEQIKQLSEEKRCAPCSSAHTAMLTLLACTWRRPRATTA